MISAMNAITPAVVTTIPAVAKPLTQSPQTSKLVASLRAPAVPPAPVQNAQPGLFHSVA